MYILVALILTKYAMIRNLDHKFFFQEIRNLRSTWPASRIDDKKRDLVHIMGMSEICPVYSKGFARAKNEER